MFNWLFGKKKAKPVLSKEDHWKAFEFYALFDDLDRVKAVLEHTNDTRIDFIAFKDDFIEELGELAGENNPDFSRVREWFAPNAEWDRLMGQQGGALGRSVFKRADWWKRNQEFLPGSMVWLSGEYGLVLNDASDGVYGLIRWDTNNAQDTEDWRGLWGTFVAMGANVLKEHEFKFIGIDGKLKRKYENGNNGILKR